MRIISERIEGLSAGINEVRSTAETSVRKVGLVRYNPFSGMGGDQSFSIALLDSKDNGFIITSLFSREGTRVYAKPVKNGQSEYQLSDEEKEAIEKAKNF